MKIIKEDIWKYWMNDCVIVIPTNGFVKKDGSLVMGRGLALQAKNYIHNIEYILGNLVKEFGNTVYYIKEAHIFSFPVKHNWWEKADLELIEKSCNRLSTSIENIITPIIMPKIGCGNGKLNWKDVEPIIKKYLKDKVVIVDLK